MPDFEFKEISYHSIDLNLEVKHQVIIAGFRKKKLLLSIPNLYLYEKTRSSKETSKRYATLITKFYKFLSKLPRFNSVSPGDYHFHVINADLKKWQVYRQINRVKNGSAHPSSETIYNDACVVLYFFKWLHERHIPINVTIHLKTWIANFKDRRLLSYIETKAKQVLDADSIRVLDKESRQKRAIRLISNNDIHTLLSCYPDMVYKTLFKFALATAMRPMELVKFPYMGNGKNRHILPYSEMSKADKTFKYSLIGKGNKFRKIIIPAYALKMLDSEYIKTEYQARAKLYKERFGKKCPLSILFLTSEGVPVTQTMIAQATNYAKKLAFKKDPDFQMSNKFYHTRKWWPTLMMIQHHNGDGILEKNAEVMDLAITEVIINQLGHENPTTTYQHYLVLGRFLVMARKGITHEHIHEKTINIYDAIAEYS
ncbi:hypothetical protein IFT75_01030 [Pseudomonas sp. CFBP 8758]|nr:hypothetical protein [Pseudomonas sp. CFBP 8758]MBD8591995.1 hypothetical protein [Pseudomonas sp. CFBP 8758]MBD8733480.1 hypothetical protein [Pseudomonas sp. CFBP 13710]